MQRGRLATAIDGGDAHQNVLDVAFGVLDRDVEVLVVGEDARIDQFVLARVAAAARIFLAQVAIREGALRIPVEALEVCVRRKRVEVPPVFFDVLAVIPPRPYKRSLMISSCSFQNAGAMHKR